MSGDDSIPMFDRCAVCGAREPGAHEPWCLTGSQWETPPAKLAAASPAERERLSQPFRPARLVVPPSSPGPLHVEVVPVDVRERFYALELPALGAGHTARASIVLPRPFQVEAFWDFDPATLPREFRQLVLGDSFEHFTAAPSIAEEGVRAGFLKLTCDARQWLITGATVDRFDLFAAPGKMPAQVVARLRMKRTIAVGSVVVDFEALSERPAETFWLSGYEVGA